MSIIPVIDNLRRNAPSAEIDVMVNKGTEEVLAHQPGVGRVWAYDRRAAKQNALHSLLYHFHLVQELRARHYHVVIDFTHGDRASFLSFLTGASCRISYLNSSNLARLLMNRFIPAEASEMHIVDYQLEALKLFGMSHFRREMKVHIPEPVHQKIDGFLNGQSNRTRMKVAIHPGSRGRLRQWPPERFAEIGRRLHSEYGAGIILVGGPSESGLVKSVEQWLGFPAIFKSTELSLLEMASLFSRCSVFVGNDSAPAHLAAAAGCPTLTLFGPTFPKMWRPLSDLGEVVFKNVECCGCRQEECIHPERTCMELIEVEEVWEKVQRMLSAGKKN
jgi:ADP-heptose:LPS heptosyltransferase